MKAKPTMPVNTVDRAVQLARVVSRDISAHESQSRRSYQVFAALTQNEVEALAAFLIWKARGESIKQLLNQKKMG
jgi:hypothetical protein